MLQCAKSFSVAIKESLKSLTEWSAFYFTSRESWYPLPDGALRFEHLKFPKPSEPPPMDTDWKFIMRQWASTNLSGNDQCDKKPPWQRQVHYPSQPTTWI